MYTIENVVRILVRRRWLLLAPLGIGLAIGLVASKLMPEKYQSETMILVVPQRIPNEIVPRNNTETVADRLNTINDVILSRSRLERIIEDLHLYTERTSLMEDMVQRMRSDIKVKVEGKESFRVTYVSNTARTAQKVTDRLASLYIEENLRDQANLSESTNQFLESSLEEAKGRLLAQEKKLEEYKNHHAGELPSQQQANLQAIQSAQSQLQAVSESTNRARERRILIERQLADAQELPVASRPTESSSSVDENAGALSTAQQLDSAQKTLAAARTRYTPDHPDVKRLERTVSDLEAKLKDESKRAPAAAATRIMSPAEASRQRQLNELNAQIEVIDHQIASNQEEEKRLKALIGEYQTRVNAVPARESELVELSRDYDTLNQSYLSLLKKQEDSKLAGNLVRRQIGEQFRVLDAASLPEKPSNRFQRLGVLVGCPIAAVLLGLAIVLLLEYRDTTVKAEADVERLLGLTVLARVPMLTSNEETKRQGRRWMFAEMLRASVLLAFVGAAIVWRIRF